MNVIFCSQGSALTIFDRLLPHLKTKLNLDKIGLFVADQLFFCRLTRASNNFTDRRIEFLKEWEILAQAKSCAIDHTLIDQYEHKLSVPNLWPALIADRRIWLGKNSKYTQDYTPRFTYTQMLKLLQTDCQQIENFITRIKPQAIIGFNMVTLSEFLFYLFARYLDIPYYQMKNAKITNLVTLFPDPLDLSGYIRQQALTVNPSNQVKQQATQYLQSAQAKQSTYEGHVLLKSPSPSAFLRLTLYKKLITALIYEFLRPSFFTHDLQSGGLTASWNFNVRKPLKAIRQRYFLSNHYLSPDQLPAAKYIFFPLHTEPEISLSVYGRFHQNQIEVARNLAQSIPATWQVIVKDHPRSLGLRSLQYYKKLLAIPNVKLVNPYLPSYDVIEHAQAVVVITSWVGFEAVISKKPVVTMGECTFNALPDPMVVKNKTYHELTRDIQNAIKNYRYDEQALLEHLTTVISISHPINMYTDILTKPNRYRTKTTSPKNSMAHFADYIAQRITGNIS